jgi:NAD(P)-dependent dehydrogenase (short-subunit alcohol dehydrogenase family)
MPTHTLDGRTALVTGAARGIGAAAVEAMIDAGASVLATDILDDEGEALVKKLGSRARYAHLDVTDELAWNDAVRRAEEHFGGLHILVNNAGIASLAPVEEEELETWERVVRINQTGVWLGMKAASAALLRSGDGSIINVSSIFGAVGGFGGSVAYHATKGAVRVMSRNAAIRWANQGIRVNSLHPGFIHTPMIDTPAGEGMKDSIVSMTPMGRIGRPEEVASVIVFLAGAGASYMTGAEIFVDGGWFAR